MNTTTIITQAAIDESLDAAVRSGYELNIWNAEDIAEDIATYDSLFENVEPAILIPFIRIWKEKHIT